MSPSSPEPDPDAFGNTVLCYPLGPKAFVLTFVLGPFRHDGVNENRVFLLPRARESAVELIPQLKGPCEAIPDLDVPAVLKVGAVAN